MTEDRRRHWEQVYDAKRADEVSWYQPRPEVSLALIARVLAPSQGGGIVDVGGGASTLVDHLLDAGYGDVTVLDLAEAALEQCRTRLGDRASAVRWQAGDVTRWTPPRSYALWHDRAVLHFFTDDADRAAYARTLDAALVAGGHAVIATFAPDGPQKCSGLPVRRQTAQEVAALTGLTLVEQRHEDHRTPGGGVQKFQYGLFRKG